MTLSGPSLTFTPTCQLRNTTAVVHWPCLGDVRALALKRCQHGGANKKKAHSKGEATILPKEEEEGLVRWINSMRDEGVPVTPTMLRLQALDVAEAAGIAPFKASWSWQNLFKGRHRFSLRCRTRQGQIRPPELAQIAADFALEVRQKATEIGATKIFNADQTGKENNYVFFWLV